MLRIGAIILVGLFCQADAVDIKCHAAFTGGNGTSALKQCDPGVLKCWRADSTYVPTTLIVLYS